MAHTEIDCNDGLDDGNEWISPSVQVSNEIKDHQDEGDGGGGERARRKMMKGEEEDEFDRKKKSGRRGESRRHESNSQRIHVSVLTFPPTYCQCWCPRKPSSIITCHWNHCLISILIILACRRDGRGGGGGGCVMGFPQGAPPEACVSLEPRHFGTQATSTSSDYYLTASSSRFGGVFGFSKSGGVKGVFFFPSFLLLLFFPSFLVLLFFLLSFLVSYFFPSFLSHFFHLNPRPLSHLTHALHIQMMNVPKMYYI